MISIIIPTFQEEGNIGRLISYLKKEAAHQAILEIIVVDGKSSDNTVEEARAAGARAILAAKKGRASQMNEGAGQAKGNILYFLHADTRPPLNFADDLVRASIRGRQAGCFRLSFDDRHFLLSLYSWFTRFNIKAFRFGDQSQFITKELFDKIGGFDESLTVMEDNEIIGRIINHCSYTLIPKYVKTSAKKYRDNGIVRLQLIFIVIFTLYNLGVSQDNLVRIYKRFIRN
ncbi:MAG: TIGR04283 family arsenosugar biosynthesis glycosyltransferase [Balneolales bacterium]